MKSDRSVGQPGHGSVLLEELKQYFLEELKQFFLTPDQSKSTALLLLASSAMLIESSWCLLHVLVHLWQKGIKLANLTP